MARDVAAVRALSDTESVRLIESNLSKGPRGRKAANEVDGEDDAEDEAEAA
jgi:CarD family transcriptional regulator